MNVPVVGRIDAGSVPSSTEIETCRYTGVSSRTSISTWCCSESNATSYISDSASGQAQHVLYTITGLNPGSHTLVIEVTGRKNTSAQSAWIWVDAFDFAP